MINPLTKIGVPASLGALVALGLIIPISEADAQRRGGGGRAGASAHRPTSHASSRQVRSSASSSINYGKHQASGAQRGRAQAGTANRRPSTGAINSGGNRSNINTGGNRTNINTGGNRTNINTGDINIDRDVDIDVDNNCCGGWGDWDYHPVAAGVAVGTAVAVTRAWTLGAYYSTLPTNCVVVVRGAVSYYQCGSYWYQPVYSGMNVQYVAVNAP